MKIVCVCSAGNHRSVALAYFLKDKKAHDAVAIGIHTAGEDLKQILFNWADKIVVMEGQFAGLIPLTYKSKILVCEVGPDVWSTPHHPELHGKIKAWLVTDPFKDAPVKLNRATAISLGSYRPLVSCICPTFGRGPKQLHLLQECVYWFTRQTYPDRELIILNDCPGQILVCEAPGVRVINHPTKIPTLGQKYDLMASYAKGEVVMPFEDDDISLPERISQAVVRLDGADYFNPQQCWYEETGVLHHDHKHGICHNAGAYKKTLWNSVKYGAATGNQDAVMDRRLKEAGKLAPPLNSPADWTYVYRWNVSSLHLSGVGGPEAMQKAYTEAKGQPGMFFIEPRMGKDYAALCLVEKT